MGALDIAAAAAAKDFLECAVNFWAMPRLAGRHRTSKSPFKLGHSHFQIRPVGVETGGYPEY
jgi:hypothetical protein